MSNAYSIDFSLL